jgi:hypothetical protein
MSSPATCTTRTADTATITGRFLRKHEGLSLSRRWPGTPPAVQVEADSARQRGASASVSLSALSWLLLHAHPLGLVQAVAHETQLSPHAQLPTHIMQHPVDPSLHEVLDPKNAIAAPAIRSAASIEPSQRAVLMALR